ncbi:hypothetical protein KC19_VG262300 [Ceratodon purpureus]|uniref:Uncharacterized protein n=1 Tax=Ceratodon purpureus TaxID=3225 RepID=A0A8T0HUM0_CERPU|nr:hypothetical protein KC19_VG262300 [Ceratodon purpureus]
MFNYLSRLSSSGRQFVSLYPVPHSLVSSLPALSTFDLTVSLSCLSSPKNLRLFSCSAISLLFCPSRPALPTLVCHMYLSSLVIVNLTHLCVDLLSLFTES